MKSFAHCSCATSPAAVTPEGHLAGTVFRSDFCGSSCASGDRCGTSTGRGADAFLRPLRLDLVGVDRPSVFATRFDTDDVLQRALTLVQMFGVTAWRRTPPTRWTAGHRRALPPPMRPALRLRSSMPGPPASAARPDDLVSRRSWSGRGALAGLGPRSRPGAILVWGVAFAIDLGTPWLAVEHSVAVPPDATHLPERFGLVYADSARRVCHRGDARHEHSGRLERGAGGIRVRRLGIVFAMWWWYLDGATGAAERHSLASRRNTVSRLELRAPAALSGNCDRGCE